MQPPSRPPSVSPFRPLQLTDFWFKCASERIAKAAAAAAQPVFVYRYDHVISFPSIFPQYGLPAVCENRTCHASEVPFVFHQFANYTPDADEMRMSAAMLAWWAAFARSGDVNTAAAADTGGVHWPLFNGTDRLNMRLGTDVGVESTTTGQKGPLVLPSCMLSLDCACRPRAANDHEGICGTVYHRVGLAPFPSRPSRWYH